MNKFGTLSILLALLFFSKVAQANLIFDIEQTAIFRNDFPGAELTGSFIIDENLFTGTGAQVFASTFGLLDFTISFAGNTFTALDSFFSDDPTVTFVDGVFDKFSFTVFEPPIFFQGTVDLSSFVFRDGSRVAGGDYAVAQRTSVPVPATLALLGLGIIGLRGRRKV
ncbi:MAG: PEP-CTERM sorting domain-containing protein [Pseudomonadota bacterium]